MRKIILYCLSGLFLISSTYGVISSLSYFSGSQVQQKEVEEATNLIQKLKEGKLKSSPVILSNVQIEAEDLPIEYLTRVTFKQCRLKGYKLKGIDLRKIKFIDTQFVESDLEGAVLWDGITYPSHISKEPSLLLKSKNIYKNFVIAAIKCITSKSYLEAIDYLVKFNQFHEILHASCLLGNDCDAAKIDSFTIYKCYHETLRYFIKKFESTGKSLIDIQGLITFSSSHSCLSYMIESAMLEGI